MSDKEECISFQEFGEQTSDIVLLFSPFLPYNNLFLNDSFYHSTIKTKKVFTNFSTKSKISSEIFSYDNILTSYIDYIKQLKQQTVILIGFGIFTNLFVRLTKVFGNRISKLILIESDFGNSILSKLFDAENKPLHKKNYFVNTFTKDFDLPQQKKFLYKHYFKYIKAIETSLRESLPQKISLKEILEIREKTFLLWHSMEKDLWPLPQILQEDYNIKTLSSNTNIIESLLTKNKNLLGSLNEFIFENLNF